MAAMTASSLVTSIDNAADIVLAIGLAKAHRHFIERRLVDVGKHHAGAFRQQLRGDGRADAAGTAGDEGDAARKALGLWHARQLRFLQQASIRC